MGKNLERFVRDNRNEFDAGTPSDAVWNRIEKNLPQGVDKKKPVRIGSVKWRWLSVAAAVILLLTTALLYFSPRNGGESVAGVQPADSKNEQQPADAEIASIDPDYANQVAQFTRVIDEKQGALKSLQKDNPSLYEQFSNDIARLDSTYSLLKRQLPVNPNKEELLQAMIYNLQLQIDLLNQQLSIIQKIKSAKSKTL